MNLNTPEVRYARSGDVSIAYQLVGNGPVDLIFVPYLINLVWAWEQPAFAEFCQRHVRRSRSCNRLRARRHRCRRRPRARHASWHHTGEVELVGGKVEGIAVHIGARVAAEAAPCEVLVSAVVRDLATGSGIEFDDRGVRALKGVPGEVRL